MAVPNVCFISANVCNYTCTSPPPQLPPKPSFCHTTTTPSPTPTGNNNETTTTPTVPPTYSTEIITDIASSFGTTTYDDGTSPMVTAKTSLISDGTTLSNPTTLKPTENSISDGMTGTTENPTTSCEPNETGCAGPTSGPSPALIAGCTCGAIIFLVLCGFLIWWLWKKGKCCFVPIGGESEAALRDNEEKQVELLKIEKKGTVILTPLDAQPALPEQGGVLSTSPNPNTDKSPGELSKKEGALPSLTTEGTPDSTTSRKKKKKKKKGSRSNRVSPEPNQIPAPATGGNDG